MSIFNMSNNLNQSVSCRRYLFFVFTWILITILFYFYSKLTCLFCTANKQFFTVFLEAGEFREEQEIWQLEIDTVNGNIKSCHTIYSISGKCFGVHFFVGWCCVFVCVNMDNYVRFCWWICVLMGIFSIVISIFKWSINSNCIHYNLDWRKRIGNRISI